MIPYDDIQYIHDVVMRALDDDNPARLTAEQAYEAAMQVNALCWVLGHTDELSACQNIKERMRRNGVHVPRLPLRVRGVS